MGVSNSKEAGGKLQVCTTWMQDDVFRSLVIVTAI